MDKHPHKYFVRITALILILVLVAGFVFLIPSRAADTSSLLKLLDSGSANNSTFKLTTSSRIYIVTSTAPDGELKQTVQLAQQKFAAAGYPSSSVMQIYWGDASFAEDGDIVVYLDASSDIDDEGYYLNVTEKAYITASHVDGLLYGLDMLLKHFRYANNNTIQGFTASDAPDTEERTVSLDCGRKYFTKEWICNFIREMSWMGYNTLELHFSEDSGFRIDIWDPTYYTDTFNPANDFSWICGSIPTYWQHGGNDYTSYKYGCTLYPTSDYPDRDKYLSAEELIEIFAVAKEYHIDIIPSFDSPSHLDYLTWRFYQYCVKEGNTDYSFESTVDNKTYKASEHNGMINYSTLENTENSYSQYYSVGRYYSAVDIRKGTMGRAFILELYIDIANFFKTYAGSADFNLCADEVNLTGNYGQVWDWDDFVVYINELTDLLQAKGYTVRACNDFLGSTTNGATSSLYDDDLEILYWNSPFNPKDGSYYDADNLTQPASFWTEAGRKVYNAIQTSTYHALRYTNGGTDARDPDSSKNNWTFYNTNEEDIYNDWNPTNIRETGVNSESSEKVDPIPAENLAGAYFMIWCDFCWISTESEMWNGAVGYTSGNTYYMRDIMWSNIIKMWNWDVNDTSNGGMNYASYAKVRDAFGSFPGIATSGSTELCSKAVVLPTATNPIPSQISLTHTIQYKSAENNELLHTETVVVSSSSFKLELTAIRGYKPTRADRATYLTEDGVSYVQGTTDVNTTITVWCEKAGDDSWLEELLRDENMEQRFNTEFNYSYASWSTYESAITEAQTSVYTSQEDIDALKDALQAAHTALVVDSYSGETYITVQQLAQVYPVGKKVGLYVTTSPNVQSLTVSRGDAVEAVTFASAQVQALDGEIVKCWLLYLPAETAGTFEYTLSYGTTTSEAVTVTVN